MTTKAPASPVIITPPNIQGVTLDIEGTAPLVINKFSAKAKQIMMDTQIAGTTAKSKKVRESKDFEELYNGARHISTEGWDGIHAAAFRNAAISACRISGFVMTKAKLAIFTEADGFDADDMTPLVRITKGEAQMIVSPCRNANGSIDLRPRPTYWPWGASLRIKFDAGVFTATDVANLIARVGLQVGIGEGRPDSKDSPGVGNGLFRVL